MNKTSSLTPTIAGNAKLQGPVRSMNPIAKLLRAREAGIFLVVIVIMSILYDCLAQFCHRRQPGDCGADHRPEFDHRHGHDPGNLDLRASTYRLARWLH